jgi:hypothetical protein
MHPPAIRTAFLHALLVVIGLSIAIGMPSASFDGTARAPARDFAAETPSGKDVCTQCKSSGPAAEKCTEGEHTSHKRRSPFDSLPPLSPLVA